MNNPICFRKNVDIGSADAESDAVYLEHCFIDTGDLATLMDCADPKCLVLGRTGVGKTALLKQVAKMGEHVAELSPEALSLNYITNSNVIKFFEGAGVNLDVFYSLLWRHVITVELLKLRFNITNENRQTEFFDSVRRFVSLDKGKDRALKYLREWGSKFWEETEYRIKEFTNKLETDLKGSVKIDQKFVQLGVDGAKKLSEEEKLEVQHRGMQVVNAVQVKELHDVIAFLSEDLFVDEQKSYYLIIDRLDEGWVDDSIRFKLIKALIEAIKTFRRIRSVKIIAAIRTDLHYRVLKETAQSGFQEEKYKSLYLQIRWSRQQLVQMLDERVRYMFKRQYTRENVSLSDILPLSQIDQRSAIEFIIDRTFFRPREAIIYLNECISRAEGQPHITVQLMRQAEVPYSQQRLSALADEWRREFPRLLDWVRIIEKMETPFVVESITAERFADFVTEILISNNGNTDQVYQACEEFFNSNQEKYFPYLEKVMQALYLVGVIGVKPDPHLGRQWSFDGQPVLNKGQLKPTSQIDVHKTFWAALGVVQRGRAAASQRKLRK